MVSQFRWENLLVLFLYCFTAHSQDVDPCSSYRALNDPYRSTGHIAQVGDQLICDRSLQAGWYRFINEVGGEMPESVVPLFHCGTQAPIWMHGSHPSTADGIVNRTACVHFMGYNCFASIPIKVKNCKHSAYYVYYLLPTSGCFLAYCAGSKVPCPRGQSGLSPNCTVLLEVNFPNALLPIPAVTFNDDGKPDVSLKCSFKFPIWNNVSFEIRWVVNGRTVDSTTKLCTSAFEGDCNTRHLLMTSKGYRPGDQVQCTLRARYNTHPNNTWTFESFSPLFFAGIEVRPTNITLKECEIERNVKLEVRPTIPLIGTQFINSIGLMFGASNGQAVLANDCDITIPTGADSVNKWISTNISVQALCDNQNGGSDQVQFTFHVTTFHSFWAQYTLPPVLITRVEKTVKLCIAWGDPHYETFDRRYYDFYRSGDFVLYRNTERTFEIHTRLWFCSSVTCNCGVAIREHKDVIILNSCVTRVLPDGREQYKMITGEPLKVRIASSGPLTRGTRIRVRHLGGHSEYEVRLPSGRRVTIKRYRRANNIYMEASQGDIGNTEGMCGNFNGDSTDDFAGGGDGQSHSDQTSFGESWRVNKSVSLFETVPDCSDKQCDDSELNMDRCECQRNQGQIHVRCGRSIMNWIDVKAKPEFRDATQQVVKAAREKRENLYSDDVIYHYDDEVYYLPHVRRRRAVQFMSEENATNYCNSTIRGTSVAKACLEISDVDANNAIRQCSEDLQITGDFSWVDSAIETIKSSCEVAVVRNVSAYDQDEDGKLVPSLKITKALCPNDCSGNGNCTDGVCVCNKEYVSADCSLRFDEIPQLFRLLDKGLCDIRARPCMKTIVFGEHFLSSENLACHVEEFPVVLSKWIPSNSTLKFNGSQTDLFAIECNLPKPPINLDDFDSGSTPAAGYRVSVSNDGFHTSQALVMITFDPKCQRCNVSSGCSLKNDSCVIRGHCFAEEEPDPKNWCQQCMPSVNQSMWTTRLVNLPPNITTPAVRYALLGEDLSLQIEGEDPENRPFDVSLMEGSPIDARLTDSRILIWKPATLNATKFYFKATDECNASSTFNMTIEIVTCPCTDKGVCVPDSMHARGSGMYICSCQPGYEGQFCENEIDECLSGPCINGSCFDDVNTYICKCNVGFTGLRCDVIVKNCSNSSCFPGVTCFQHNDSISCDACPVGFAGDGKNCDDVDDCLNRTCNNGGSCVDGVNSYACVCLDGFSGDHCETEKTVKPTDPDNEVTTSTTTSKRKTEEQKEFVVELRIYEEWNDDLRDEDSTAYKKLSKSLEETIWKYYIESDKLKQVKILSFRPGSIMAEFQLLFKSKLEDEEALEPLRKEIQSGKLGNLNVDRTSLKIKKKEREGKEDKQISLPLVIGISCGVLFVLPITIICVVRYCKKGRPKSARRVSGEMPQEVNPSDLTSYTVKKAQRELEHHPYYEEIGLWNRGMAQ